MAGDVGLSLLPVPLIHLAGLDVQRNAVHKYIQDSFRTSQNVAARFDFVPIDSTYAQKKETREHIEQYIPRGIFKKRWMIKHLSELPSVICLFVDLEWTDQNWDQRLTEIVSKIAIIRHLIQGRRIQICLVLLQGAEGGEKNTKRVDELQEQTELNRNRIFVLPVTPDHLTGYIQQLQARLLERANSFYESIITELKLRIENNASKIYPLLFCRYLFKVAFFCEVTRNFEDAITFYKHCFSKLTMADLIPMTATNYTELREFASLVNYKLVKLYLTVPPYFQRDFALKQFHRHIDYFSRFKGAPELGFEYYAWLGQQYRSYGELLSEYNNGLRVNSQPAFFLLKSANFERRRAEFVRQIRAQVLAQAYPKPDPLGNEQVFLGERVWRKNGLRTELSAANSQAEMIATFSLQYKECHFDHCLEITRTLHKANSEFTNSGYMKFRPQLLVTMAEEYIKSGEPEGRTRAATLLHKCSELINPTWPLLATKCYSLLRECLAPSESQKLARCLFFLASPFSRCSQSEKEAFTSDFTNLCSSIPEKISIDGQYGFVKCYFEFSEPAFHAASELTLNVELKNDCVNTPITINNIDAKYSQSCANESVFINEPITFAPGETKSFSFKYKIPATLTAKNLVAEEISINIGKVTIQFDRSGLKPRGLIPFESDVARDALCLRVAEHSKSTPQSCKILQRTAQMSLAMSDPIKIFSNEMVKVEITYSVEEDYSKDDAKLTVQCNKESSIGMSKGDLQVKDPNQCLTFNMSSSSETFTVWMKNETTTFTEPSLLVASMNLSIDDYACSLRAERRLLPALPFKVSAKSITPLFMPILALSSACTSLLAVVTVELVEKDLRVHIPLRLNRIEYAESDYIAQIPSPLAQEPVDLDFGDSAQFVIPLAKKDGALPTNSMSVELGKLKIFWSRKDSDDEEFCFLTSLGTLPIAKDEEEISLTAKLPDVCEQWQPFDLEIEISNVSTQLKSCSLEVETSNDFQILSLPRNFSLLPSEPGHIAKVSYFPVNSGELLLPKLTLKHSGDQSVPIHSVISRSLLVHPNPSKSEFARLKAYPVNYDA